MSEDAIPKGFWQAADGSLTRIDKIKDVDKARDQVVRELMKEAQYVSEVIAKFKAHVMGSVQNFVELSATQYGATMRGAKGKGNITLTSYDGSLKIVRSVQEKLVFDERLQIAKSLIDECIKSWSKGSNANLGVLVKDAFQVDKAGNVNTARVLGLRRHNIEDPKWIEAMQAISDAAHAGHSKPYVRFYMVDQDGKERAVPLDISAL